MIEISPTLLESIEPYLRIVVFSFILACIALVEISFPRRTLNTSKSQRWMYNFSLLLLNTAAIRFIFPLAAVGIAQYASDQSFGILNQINIQSGLAFVIGFIILDLCIYWQHRLFHKIPLFWRLHKVHHSDIDFDTTTGFRFHPIEIVLSMLIKAAIIIAIGIPSQSVMLFEVVLSSTALFNHGNINIPASIDRYLRCLIVTPDMHRVHHSIELQESNRNFGFNFPWWDRLFNSYQAQPHAGHTQMKIGLAEYPNHVNIKLFRLLAMPLAKPTKADIQT